MLYVAFDDIGRCLVAREDPDPARRAERADYGGVVAIRFAPAQHDLAGGAPDTTGAGLLAGAQLAIVAGATLAGSALVSPLLAVPAGVVAAVYVARRHNLARAGLEQRWTDDHRLLTTRPEVARFRRAFDAARTILVAWPFLAELVQVPSPRAEVTRSLWTLSRLLRDHAELAEQYAGLNDARFGALPPEASVRAALDDRLLRVETRRRSVSADIDRRIETLTTLAARCAGFVRTESALHTAYEAVRRADETLRRRTPPPDEAQDLAERTAAVLDAYRELTSRPAK
ncbi:hypothetical protein [Dactylosporangium sp. CA-139066]|uniref:hypothetical protein n=1 Tax=Dactylosporangium sp. CA-139066 TaxID=3239930 RepID=UPI003D89CC63